MLGSDSWEYCELLKKQIKISNVSIEKLSEGLCSPSMLSRICNGERTANKMMRDRLMQRLGMADDRNENFIFNEEYKKWKIRQRIVILINEENLVEAEELLNVYEKNLCNKVEEQFVQVMRIQIYQMRELESEKLKKLYENALKLTVPHIDEKKVNELQLSVQELNLVLEYMNYCYPDKLYSKCEELNEYVKKVIMDEQCRAKILPKIILYQCRTLHNKKEVNYILLLKKCNIAIECLRDAKRMFFLWELLQEREWIYEKIISDLIQKEENEKVNIFLNLRKENKQWITVIQSLYNDYDMESEIHNCCYLYIERNTNCINDIVRKRRLMLGLTKKQLCKGICSEKTIGRLENLGGKTQLLIVKEIFERLKISGEYQRKDIITRNPKAYEILEQIVKYGNDRRYDLALNKLQDLEKIICMKEPLNRQYIERQKNVILYQKGEITKDVALQRIVDALENTVTLKNIEECVDLYLTHGEITCVQNLAYVQGKQEMNKYYELLVKICGEYEQKDEILENISMYEFIMTSVASVLGNIGEYEKSNTLSKKIIKECIRCRRLGMIAMNMYSIAWNHKEMNGITYSQEIWKENVRNSAILFHIEKNFNIEKILMKKL